MTRPLKNFSPPPELTDTPTVSLYGAVDETMLATWLEALAKARAGAGPLVMEMATTGGDAEIGRRIADDIRLFREQTARRALFLGRATVYSAGVTIMGGFLRSDRWLSRDAVLMIHGRKLAKCLDIDGPLRSERAKVEALLAEIDEGLRMERAGFERLIEGSNLTLEEMQKQTAWNWYLPAQEALDRGLVAGLI